MKIFITNMVKLLLMRIYDCIHFSSVSVWAKNCEALSLPDDERQQLNAFIDKLYSDMDDGEHGLCIMSACIKCKELNGMYCGKVCVISIKSCILFVLFCICFYETEPHVGSSSCGFLLE